jgi:hypothetical protein
VDCSSCGSIRTCITGVRPGHGPLMAMLAFTCWSYSLPCILSRLTITSMQTTHLLTVRIPRTWLSGYTSPMVQSDQSQGSVEQRRGGSQCPGVPCTFRRCRPPWNSFLHLRWLRNSLPRCWRTPPGTHVTSRIHMFQSS